jgi:hypothetical protein
VTKGARRFAALAAVLGLAACAQASTSDSVPVLNTLSTPQPPPPVDHLAPGELVEGSESAFGMALPRDVHIDSMFALVVYASGDVSVHSLTKYLRARLQGGSLDEDDSGSTFVHTRIASQPGREFFIRIRRTPRGSLAEIRDSTQPPAPDLPDEAARWRAVGLTPQGRVLDPTHLD